MDKSQIDIYYSPNINESLYTSPLDLVFYYDDAFRHTMYFFKDRNDSCYHKYMRKLFTFGRNSVIMFFTTNIIGYFIIKNQLLNQTQHLSLSRDN